MSVGGADDRAPPGSRVKPQIDAMNREDEAMNLIERVSPLSAIALSAAALIILAIGAALRPVTASEAPAGGVVSATERTQPGFRTEARASARASAAATAQATGERECSARSSALAEAKSGRDHDYQEDHDSADQSSGNCRAESSSRAKAGSIPSGE